jgi:tetratricopeptide (TPR) repeat protein
MLTRVILGPVGFALSKKTRDLPAHARAADSTLRAADPTDACTIAVEPAAGFSPDRSVTGHRSPVTGHVIGAAAAMFLLVSSGMAVAGEKEWRKLQEQAQVSFQQGDLGRAEQFARQALLEADSSLGAYHRATEESLNILSLALRMQKKPGDALPFAQRLVAIRMRRYGPKNIETAIALHNNAEILIALNQFAAAEEVQRAALDIFTAQLGPNHSNTAAALHNLGAIRLKQGRYAEAEQYLRRALAAKEQALPPGHLSIAHTLDNLAVALESEGKHAEAQKYQRRANAIREAAARGQAAR